MNFAYGWAFSQAGPEDLLQHHDHRAVGGGGAASSARIELLSVLAGPARLTRRRLGLRLAPRPEPASATRSSGCSSSPGRSRWRCGGSATSRRSGRAGLRAQRTRRMTRAPHTPRSSSETSTEVAEAVRASGGRLTRRGRPCSRRCSPPRDRSPPSRSPTEAAWERLDRVSVYRTSSTSSSSGSSSTSTSDTAPGCTR